MKTYQIHLIRNGITEGNLKGQYIGSTDLPLAPEGVEQIKHLDANYIYPGAAAYFLSPMLRCRQTLELIYPAAKPIEIDAFRECDFGEFEGLTAEDLKDVNEFSEWLAANGSSAPPSGESGDQFGSRVTKAFERIVDALLKTGTPSAVLVTHGGVISTILAQYGLPEAPVADWTMAPGCGYSIRIHPQMWSAGRKVEVYQQLPKPRDDDELYRDEEAYIFDVDEIKSEDEQKENKENEDGN